MFILHQLLYVQAAFHLFQCLAQSGLTFSFRQQLSFGCVTNCKHSQASAHQTRVGFPGGENLGGPAIPLKLNGRPR